MDQCGLNFDSSLPKVTVPDDLPNMLTCSSTDISSTPRDEDMSSTPTKKNSKTDKWGEDSFQKEIDKWEEFYDDMKAYLTDGVISARCHSNLVKQANSFFLGPDNLLYYTKPVRDTAATLKLPVVRSYKERMQVCKTIHLSTGEEGIHHRRDTMLELLGQQYYWKGQRRDVCQCIASCDMCSLGLGAKRRAKPPGQRRDIRPPKKLLKVGPSVAGISTTSQPLLCSSAIALQTNTEKTDSNTVSPESDKHDSWQSYSPPTTASVNTYSTCSLPSNSSLSIAPHSAFTPVNPLSNLYTIADACLSVKTTESSNSCSTPRAPSVKSNTDKAKIVDMSVASEVVVSENSGLQIFTTINEPCYENHDGIARCTVSDSSLLQSSLCVGNAKVVADGSGDEERYVVQGSSMAGAEHRNSSFASEREEDNVPSSESSIYQLLFQLPSVPNTTLCTAVIESMQMSLKSTANEDQLAQVSSQSLLSVFNLSPSTSVALVCPSRAAAYISSLTAALIKQGYLCTVLHTTQTGPLPPVVLHDTASVDKGSLETLSSLVGACNWNVGTHTQPMDRDTLQAAVTSNRVSAILHRPFAYPSNTSFLPLNSLCSLCRSNNIAIISDCYDMPGHSLVQLTSTVTDMITTGADLIMLPTTGNFQGPPHTCVLIGKIDLLGNHWQQLSLLQNQLSLPLVSPAYDTVGTVVAFKSLQVSSLKRNS